MAPGQVGDPVARIEMLVTAQSALLDAWVAFRCREESDLDDAKVRRALDGYLRWTGHLMAASLANLKRRRWNGLLEMLDEAIVVHCLVRRLSQDRSPWLAGDIERPLQIAMVVGGEKRVRAIDEDARGLATLAVLAMAGDLTEAGEASLAVSPEPLPTLERVTTGGRDLSSDEERCAGRWIYQEFYSSGGFSARTELHMVLLPNGLSMRSSGTVASSTFRDSSGGWSGAMDARSRLQSGERGRWRLDGRLLTLEMDDGSAYEYEVTLSGSSLMTRNTTGGQQRFWVRSKL